MGELKIKAEGRSWLVSVDVKAGSLTLTGAGELYVKNSGAEDNFGLRVTGALTVSGPRVEVNGATYGDKSRGVIAGGVSVTAGSLTAYGGAAGIASDTAPTGVSFAEGGFDEITGILTSGDVSALTNTADTGFVSKPCARIASPGLPRLLVGGTYDENTLKTSGYTQVDTSANAAGAGWSYTQLTNTLALNGYTGGCIFAEYMGGDFKITLTGESVIPESGKVYDPLTWNNCCILIKDTPLTTVSGTGSLQSEGTLAVIEGSLTVKDATLAVGCGEGGEGSDPFADWYTTKSYDGVAMFSDREDLIGYCSDFEPKLTVSGDASVTAVGYYNGVCFNTAQRRQGHLLVEENGWLQGSGDGVGMGVQVDGEATVTGGMLIGRGVVEDGYQRNGGCGIMASGGMTVSGGTVIANGYNYGVDLTYADALGNYLGAAPLTVSGAGCLIAEGRTILGAGVSAPAISPKQGTEAGEEYDHVTHEGITKTGDYGGAKCVIGGFAVSCAQTANGALTPDLTRAGAGTKVTVTAEPDAGYKLKAGTLKYSAAQGAGETAVSADANGAYSFIMPACAVTLTAEFEAGTPTATALEPARATYDGTARAFPDAAAVTYESGGAQTPVPGAAVTYVYSAEENGTYGGAAPDGAAPVNAGSYWAVADIKADGNYGANSDKAEVKRNPKAISSGMVSAIETLTYTGLPQTPALTVRHSSGGAILTACSLDHEHDGSGCSGDYYAVYENNTNAYASEPARVTVHGVGNYKDATTTASKTFVIQPYDVTESSAIVSVTGFWPYDGSTRSGPVTVTFNGVNGEKPKATATGTVAATAAQTYTAASLSNVAMTGLNDRNYYYSESYAGITVGVSVTITGAGDEEAPPVTVPVTGEGTVKATAVTITDRQLAAVLGFGTEKVAVDASSLDKVSEVKLSSGTVDAIAKAGSVSLTVETKAGAVSFSSNALKSIAQDAGALRVTVERISEEELTDGQKELLGKNAAVLKLELWKGETKLHDFGGEATVGIPYSGEPEEGMLVWRMTANADGKIALEPLKVTVNREKNRYEFVTDRFPEYALARFPFTDLDGEKWYYEDAVYACMNGLLEGTGASEFKPEADMSRAMLVTVLWRMEGEIAAEKSCGFTDLTETWYKNAVAWAAENELVNGYDAERFGPDDAVTREQLAAILYRYERYKGGGFTGAWSFRLDFTDAGKVSEWAYEPVCWCVMNGIINGTTAAATARSTLREARSAAKPPPCCAGLPPLRRAGLFGKRTFKVNNRGSQANYRLAPSALFTSYLEVSFTRNLCSIAAA